MFAITSCLVFGQGRLGHSAAEIRKEFSNSSNELTSGYTDDGIYYISTKTERSTIMYLFNTDKICKSVFIFPKNDRELNFYIEMFNKVFVNISSTKWNVYTNQGNANIELMYPEEGVSCFVWVQEKKK
jgi:hypothetical protein